jgi:hypothetical protein
MAEKQPDYASYLLRLWRARGEERAAWRASLESPHTGERKGFASLEDLFNFLRQQTGVASDSCEGDRLGVRHKRSWPY